MSDSECTTLILGNDSNVVIMEKEGTSTSFRCRSGDCGEVAGLYDYFWGLKRRYKFIKYLFVEY